MVAGRAGVPTVRRMELVRAPVVDGGTPLDVAFSRGLARWMDEAVTIPGTNIKVGLDAVMGLLPGGGDAVGSVLGVATVVTAIRHRVPARVVLAMLGWLLLDAVVGAVPLLGDLLDVGIRAHTRNARLLEDHRNQALEPRTLPMVLQVAAGGVALVLGGVSLALGWLGVALVGMVWSLLGGG
jgi:hypothetical protein